MWKVFLETHGGQENPSITYDAFVRKFFLDAQQEPLSGLTHYEPVPACGCRCVLAKETARWICMKKLGVPTLINGLGTVTRIGGSLMAPGVIEAMREASLHFVDMNEFHREAGKHIAKLLGSEGCCITCGAAAGLAISAAACMTRGDAAKKLQLPDTAGMKHEAIMLKAHRILYDQALRLSGAKIVEVGVTSSALPAQVEAAIGEQTALFVYVAEAEPMRGSVPLPQLIPILKKHGIPVLVDAAAEIPPRENFLKYLDMGADLVTFSGGKRAARSAILGADPRPEGPD